MAIKLEKGKLILKDTIQNDIRHRDYKKTVELAAKYTRYVTGKDIGALLQRFVPRESAVLFAQRVLLTTLTTPDIANTLTTPMYKVGRTTPNVSIAFKDGETAGDKEKDKAKELADAAATFWGDASVDYYLTYNLPTLDSTDPNSFIVVEFEGSVDPNKNEKADPYPFEVNSKEAINYQYANNLLQFLVVMNDNEDKFTIYLDDESIVAVKFDKKDQAQVIADNPKAEIWYKDEDDKEKSDRYYVLVFEHKAGRMPARRVGSVLDISTRKRTCVPVIHAANAYFEKAIKTVSEFDITNALHTYPKVFRYGNPCPGDMDNGILCDGGSYTLENKKHKCPICKGTGWDSATTTAEETIVKAPKDLSTMVNLEVMMAYKSPPVDLVEFQKKLGLYELKELAIKAVYSGDTYVSDKVVTTATEKNIDLEAVYDTLKPFADGWSAMWIHIMSTIASYLDLGKDTTIVHTFPKDFKMKSLSMLLIDLKAAADSGAPSYVKSAIQKDIAEKIYIDQPDELLKLKVKESFYPFLGKSEDEINYIISSGNATKEDMVLYMKFDNMFVELEQEQGDKVDFYAMDIKKQKELLDKKVAAYIKLVEESDAAARAIDFNRPTE